MDQKTRWLEPNGVYCADARELACLIQPETIALSVWSPPYHVGKNYERDVTFVDWKNLLRRVIEAHSTVLKPGGFLAINIADILCFKDESMPRIMAENVSRRKRGDITKELVVAQIQKTPNASRYELAATLGCSEQTIDRRLKGNNIRGGKYESQTRVLLVGGLLEQFAMEAGLFLYDRRTWVKDAAWENSRWHTMSYRAVDEFEYVYIFWKPGQTKVDKNRLTRDEWTAWGSRAVWAIPSVRSNSDHDSKFPVELPRRLIQLLSEPGDVVLDCFVGSGTSAIAAAQERRNFIGFDLSERSAGMASRAYATALRENRFEQSKLFAVQQKRAKYG
jgi:DNA modification methylase